MRRFLGIMLALGLIASSQAWAADSNGDGQLDRGQGAAIEKLIHDYIINHPEVILESVQRLQARQQQQQEERMRQAAGAVKPVTSEDHILGDPNAPVKLIEFSDFECPFCKQFHKTLARVMDHYGKSGEVAWVYRHFPIDQIHPKSRKEAQAAECANELGGNKAFWAYADKIFATTPSNNRLDLTLLPKFAVEIGLDRAKFETCLSGDRRGGKYAAHIEADFQDASTAGGTGTPYTVIVARDGRTFPINGAQPYGVVKSVIDLALKEK